MLMHYLLQGEEHKRRPQLARFVDLQRANVSIADAFQQAFQTTVESLEKDFKSYIQGSKYMATGITFEKKLDFDSEMQGAPLTDAEAQAYLGDLLMHTHRLTDAETYLQKALSLTPDLPKAQASLGMLRVHQGRLEDARKYLEKAVAENSQNYQTHYYYALALSGLESSHYQFVSSFPPDTAVTMRAELKKAIALKPDFPESYALLGFVNVVRNEELDETIELLKHALNFSRANQRILFMLAQIYIRKERFAEARQLLDPIAQNSPNPDMRQQAQALLEGVKRTEEQMARFKEYQKEAAARETAARAVPVEGPTLTATPTQDDQNTALEEALRKPQAGEKHLQGMLTAVQCDAKGIVFQVRAGDRQFKFHSDNFEKVDITAFTTDVSGDVTCGARKPENAVVITFTAAKAGSKFEGEAVALEFVPPKFVLKQ